jgi:hypothetical protein
MDLRVSGPEEYWKTSLLITGGMIDARKINISS